MARVRTIPDAGRLPSCCRGATVRLKFCHFSAGTPGIRVVLTSC
jgi:hypothetical protein